MDRKSIIITILIFMIVFSVGVDILMMMALKETKTQVLQHEVTTQEMIGKELLLDAKNKDFFFLPTLDAEPDENMSDLEIVIEGEIKEGIATYSEALKTLAYIEGKWSREELAHEFARQLLQQSDLWTGAKILGPDPKDGGVVTVLLRQESGVLMLMISQARGTKANDQGIQYSRNRLDLMYRFHAAPKYELEGDQRWEGILKPVNTQPGNTKP